MIDEAQKQTTYPCFRRYKDGNFIVCFVSPQAGFIVWTNEKENRGVGFNHDSWIKAEEDCWSPVEGEVVTSIKDGVLVTEFIEVEKEEPVLKLKYPCLMKSKKTGTVAIFYNDATATIVSDGLATSHIGAQLLPELKNWEPFHGSVTLTQD
jgi:hypothetical protein